MAFSADEVRVVRRALAEVLHPSRTAAAAAVVAPRPAEYPPPAAYVQDVQDYLRLAEAVDDAACEAGRLRAFLLDELRRYRQALPGTAAGYLERLTAALTGGYLPGAEDLAALRLLRSLPCGAHEYRRRTAVLRRCETLAENDVRLRLEAHMPAPRRLLTLPGLTEEPEPDQNPPSPQPPAQPGKDQPAPPRRRTPTPAEIWPPHRRRTRRPDQARTA
ncbi:hypothetical protein [Streptomyces sp.]|uniref:hypothetical protein n=1 Tax=Streptomyces sp. TaxID=1931 RepID=UPI002F41A94E